MLVMTWKDIDSNSSDPSGKERTTRAKIADECLRSGYYEEALSLYQKELDYLRRRGIGSTGQDVHGLALYDVALTSSCQCKWKDAVKAGEEAMECLNSDHYLNPDCQGPKDPTRYANIYLVARFMADLYLYLGRYEEGESLHNRVMSTWPTDADDTVDIGNLISLAKYSYFRATIDLEHVFVIIAYAQQAIEKKEDPKFKHLYSQELNILKGYVLQSKRKYKVAGLIYQQVYDSLEKELGYDHPATVFASMRIAETYMYLPQQKRGMSYDLFSSARYVSELTLGKNHNNTLDAIYHIACIFEIQKKYREALELFEQVQNTRTATLGANHISNLEIFESLGTISFVQGKMDNAAKYFQMVFDGREEILGAEHQLTLEARNNLRSCTKPLTSYPGPPFRYKGWYRAHGVE